MLTAAVAWKKRLSTSTTAIEFSRSRITSGSGQLRRTEEARDYVVDNVLLPFQGEKRVVFLAVARMVIWTTRKKGLYDDANFSHQAST